MTIFEQFNQLLANDDPQIHDYVEREEDVIILHEIDEDDTNLKLVFASTPGHGYFGFVNHENDLFIVGEEDDGIQEELIMELFEVDEYGRKI